MKAFNLLGQGAKMKKQEFIFKPRYLSESLNKFFHI